MSKPIIDGKKHISEKPKGKSTAAAFSPRSLLDVPEDLKRELEEKGLECRWVDAKQMAEAGNMHRNHWEIYRRDPASISSEAKVFGLPPDGTIRRGTVVLAVRPKDLGQAHKAMLKEKADRLTTSVKKQGAELKQLARRANVLDRIEDDIEIT